MLINNFNVDNVIRIHSLVPLTDNLEILAELTISELCSIYRQEVGELSAGTDSC